MTTEQTKALIERGKELGELGLSLDDLAIVILALKDGCKVIVSKDEDGEFEINID